MKFRKGQIYLIEFLDHSVGMHEPIKIRFVGILYKQDKQCLYMVSWLPLHDDNDLVEQNLEKTTIVKSTIVKARKL